MTVIYIKIYKFHEMYLWHYLETKRAAIICNSIVSFTKEISPNDNRKPFAGLYIYMHIYINKDIYILRLSVGDIFFVKDTVLLHIITARFVSR